MRHIPISAVEDAAAARLRGGRAHAARRLDLPLRTPDGDAVEVYLKLECLQPIGSFKMRGAWNAVRQLGADAI